MSITQKIKTTDRAFPDMLLIEPDLAEMHIKDILTAEPARRAAELAEVLLVISHALETGEPMEKTKATLALLIELAWQHSKQYEQSLEHFTRILSGVALPDEKIVFDFSKPKAAAPIEQEPSGPRFTPDRLQFLADTLADFVEDESMPREMRGRVADLVNELTTDLDGGQEAITNWLRGQFTEAVKRATESEPAGDE